MNKPIFIHVPRTGGTSIRAMFDGHIRCYGHQAARNLKLDAWSFAFVRNPYERATSWYYRTPTDMSFERWCINDAHKHLGHPSNSVKLLLTDEDGRLLVDRVYRFELWQCSILSLRRRLFCDVKSKHLNKRGNYTAWQDLYTDKARRIIYDLCQWDFKMYYETYCVGGN